MNKSRRLFEKASALALLSAMSAGVLSQEKRTPSLSDLTPDNARHFAETAVSQMKKNEGITLDYSPDSLHHIDSMVLDFRDGGFTVQQITGTLVAFGCYVGEVMVRNLDARWDYPNKRERSLGFDIIGVRLKSGGFWHPIGKVFKLMENGSEDSVAYLYSAVKGRNP